MYCLFTIQIDVAATKINIICKCPLNFLKIRLGTIIIYISFELKINGYQFQIHYTFTSCVSTLLIKLILIKQLYLPYTVLFRFRYFQIFFDYSSVVFSVNQRGTFPHFSPSYHHYRFPPKMRFDKNEILQINKSILFKYNGIVNNLGFQKIRSTFFSLVCA